MQNRLFFKIFQNGLLYCILKVYYSLFGRLDKERVQYLNALKKEYRFLHKDEKRFATIYLRDVLIITEQEFMQDALKDKRKFEGAGLSASVIKYNSFLKDPIWGASFFAFKINRNNEIFKIKDNLSCHNQTLVTTQKHETCTKQKNGQLLIIESERWLISPHVAIVLPSTYISGGVMVALTHACFLQDNGWNVDILVSVDNQECENETFFYGHHFYTYNYNNGIIDAQFDLMIATQWGTVDYVQKYPKARKKLYFVQNYETDFYLNGDVNRALAEATYYKKGFIEYYTMSRWCQDWLKRKYTIHAEYIPNGILSDSFKRRKRIFEDKIRILVEGDCSLACKNVDESFKIIDELENDRFEIWYLSYNANPKNWYKIDRFFHKIPYEDVHKVYEQCDILLKSSTLESFSYPPLEMMASGGFVVVVENEGNTEYIKDGINCLTYPLGDISKGVEAVNRICEEENLREKLYAGACETVDLKDWSRIREKLTGFYSSYLLTVSGEKKEQIYGI